MRNAGLPLLGALLLSASSVCPQTGPPEWVLNYLARPPAREILKDQFLTESREISLEVTVNVLGTISLIIDRPKPAHIKDRWDCDPVKEKTNVHVCTLNFENEPDGVYMLRFVHNEGQVSSGQEAPKIIFVVKLTRTNLSGPLQMFIDENRDFTLSIMVQREVNQVVVRPAGSNIVVDSSKPEKPEYDNQGNKLGYRWTAKFNLDRYKDELKRLADQNIGLALHVTANSAEKGDETILDIELRVVQASEKLAKALSDADYKILNGDSGGAVADLKKQLNTSDEEAVSYLVEQLKKERTKGKRIFAAFRIAGDVAASYFGIPVYVRH